MKGKRVQNSKAFSWPPMMSCVEISYPEGEIHRTRKPAGEGWKDPESTFQTGMVASEGNAIYSGTASIVRVKESFRSSAIMSSVVAIQ